MLRKAENLQERAKEAVDVAKAEDEMLGENAGIFMFQCIDFFGCFESVKNGDEFVGGGRILSGSLRVGPVPKRPQ